MRCEGDAETVLDSSGDGMGVEAEAEAGGVVVEADGERLWESGDCWPGNESCSEKLSSSTHWWRRSLEKPESIRTWRFLRASTRISWAVLAESSGCC